MITEASTSFKRLLPELEDWRRHSSALISFENLAAYENYRARLRGDSEGMANFNFAEENRFILAEERTFLRPVTL
jgi:hypothetical protein